MSVISFTLMGIDKAKARRGSRRIPEKTLFLFTLLGGGIGGTLGMHVFHHKTRHWYFAVFFPLIAIAQIALCASNFKRREKINGGEAQTSPPFLSFLIRTPVTGHEPAVNSNYPNLAI